MLKKYITITKQSYFEVQYADYKTMSHNLDLDTF